MAVAVYSTYEAKARFSEVMRKVRAGQRVVIAYRGQEVAEIVPIRPHRDGLARPLARLEEEGLLSPAPRPIGALRALVKRPGALRRFLESRE